MTFGELAAALHPDPPVHLSGLESITADMIAWQESGYSTDGMSLPPVFATVRLIASTIDQLDLVADFEPSTWLSSPRRYGSALDAGDLIQWVVSSMALNGSADVLCTRVGDSWRLDALHPGSVRVQPSTMGPVGFTYWLGPDEVRPVPAFADEWGSGRFLLHIPYLITPQHPAGCSPLTVARESLVGYIAVERQAANLLDQGTHSGGRLETDQDITTATAERYQTKWIENRKERKIPVTGSGLHYINDLINPADAQWLESRQFNAQQIAQMFGVPTDYLGMAMAGGNSSLSYANAQDNDRRFRRNCLEHFTSQIEDALSQLAPPGRGPGESKAVRFDYTGWESLGSPGGAE